MRATCLSHTFLRKASTSSSTSCTIPGRRREIAGSFPLLVDDILVLGRHTDSCARWGGDQTTSGQEHNRTKSKRLTRRDTRRRWGSAEILRRIGGRSGTLQLDLQCVLPHDEPLPSGDRDGGGEPVAGDAALERWRTHASPSHRQIGRSSTTVLLRMSRFGCLEHRCRRALKTYTESPRARRNTIVPL
jgi:hypothetical protein